MRHLDHALAAAEAEGLEPFATKLAVLRALAQARAGDGVAASTAARAAARASASEGPILQVFARLAVGVLAALTHADRAVVDLEATCALAEDAGYPWGAGMSQRALGAVALLAGDLAGARRHLGRSLKAFVDMGQLGEAAGTLRWVAARLAAEGGADAAASVCPAEPVGPPLVDVLERAHLDRPLAGIVPRAAVDDLRPVLAVARTALAAPPDQPTTTASPASDRAGSPSLTALWVREGAVWALTYDGVTVRVPDAKGLVDLAALLSRPGRELPATELMGAAVDSADLSPVIDTTARRAGGSAERARSAVTRRIREAIRRVTDVHPTLGAHLRRAVRTGRWCAYEPDEPVRWTVQANHVAGADAPRRR